MSHQEPYMTIPTRHSQQELPLRKKGVPQSPRTKRAARVNYLKYQIANRFMNYSVSRQIRDICQANYEVTGTSIDPVAVNILAQITLLEEQVKLAWAEAESLATDLSVHFKNSTSETPK